MYVVDSRYLPSQQQSSGVFIDIYRGSVVLSFYIAAASYSLKVRAATLFSLFNY